MLQGHRSAAKLQLAVRSLREGTMSTSAAPKTSLLVVTSIAGALLGSFAGFFVLVQLVPVLVVAAALGAMLPERRKPWLGAIAIALGQALFFLWCGVET